MIWYYTCGRKKTSINKNLKLKWFLFIHFQLARSCIFLLSCIFFFFSFQLCFPHSSEWSTEECAFNESIPSVRTSSITHSEVCGLFRVTGTCSCWIFRLLWDFLHDYITSENCSYLYDGVGERKQQLQRKISSTDCWLNSGLWEGLSLSKLSLGQRRHTIIGHVLERACFFFF